MSGYSSSQCDKQMTGRHFLKAFQMGFLALLDDILQLYVLSRFFHINGCLKVLMQSNGCVYFFNWLQQSNIVFACFQNMKGLLPNTLVELFKQKKESQATKNQSTFISIFKWRYGQTPQGDLGLCARDFTGTWYVFCQSCGLFLFTIT